MPDEKDKSDDKKNGAYTSEFEIVEEGQETAGGDDKGGKEKVAGDAGYADADDDERLSAGQRDDDDPDAGGGDDKGEDKNLTPEQITAKREKRRKERQAQRRRQTIARQRTNTELTFLRTRNEQLERQLSRIDSVDQRVKQTELSVVEGRIQQLQAAIAEADAVLAQAVTDNNGADVVKATNIKNELQQGLNRLTAHKQTLAKAPAGDEDDADGGKGKDKGGEGGGKARTDANAPSPGALRNARVFYNRHMDWYDPQGGDQDSKVVLALDEQITQEGFNPETKEYWEELEDRMREQLPHRMEDLDGAGEGQGERGGKGRANGHGGNGADKGAGGGKKPAGGPRMPSGTQSQGGGKRFFLSAERKAAMVEAGVWDDAKLRDNMIRAYQKWDAEEAGRAKR